MYRFLCLVLVLCAVNGKQLGSRRMKRSVHQPVFRDCGSTSSVIEFKELHFTPDPIVLPGKMVLTFHAANSRTLPNMDIKVRMARKMSLGSWTWDMVIPCVAEVGSCTYEDICQRMQDAQDQAEDLPALRKLREGLAASGAPSRCPIGPSTLNIRNLELDLPEVPSVMSSLADGTYSLTYRVLEHNNPDVELGCLSVEATISTQVEKEDDCWLWC